MTIKRTLLLTSLFLFLIHAPQKCIAKKQKDTKAQYIELNQAMRNRDIAAFISMGLTLVSTFTTEKTNTFGLICASISFLFLSITEACRVKKIKKQIESANKSK